MKKNSAKDYEGLIITIRKNTFPKLYAAKVKEYMDAGYSQNEAEYRADGLEVELELYTEDNQGIFAVESAAVESEDIYSPYTKEKLEDYDED